MDSFYINVFIDTIELSRWYLEFVDRPCMVSRVFERLSIPSPFPHALFHRVFVERRVRISTGSIRIHNPCKSRLTLSALSDTQITREWTTYYSAICKYNDNIILWIIAFCNALDMRHKMSNFGCIRQSCDFSCFFYLFDFFHLVCRLFEWN